MNLKNLLKLEIKLNCYIRNEKEKFPDGKMSNLTILR